MNKILFGSFVMFSLFVFASTADASDLVHRFNSPAFNGQGYSAHALTIENQEFSRKKAIKEKKEADAKQAERDAKSTNLSKFLANVESRIYAQLSKQLVDNMFGEASSTSGSVTFEGTTISYVKGSEDVTLTIVDENGSTTAITVPIGDFTF